MEGAVPAAILTVSPVPALVRPRLMVLPAVLLPRKTVGELRVMPPVEPALRTTEEVRAWEEPMVTCDTPAAVVAVATETEAVPVVTVLAMRTVSLFPAEACPREREQPVVSPREIGQVKVERSAAMTRLPPLGVREIPSPATGGRIETPARVRVPSILQL